MSAQVKIGAPSALGFRAALEGRRHSYSDGNGQFETGWRGLALKFGFAETIARSGERVGARLTEAVVHVDLVRAIRQEILLEVLAVSRADRGLLYETWPGATSYQVVAISEGHQSSSNAETEWHSGSPFVKWLRVNQVVLTIPDKTGVYELLQPGERRTLMNQEVYGAVPLSYRRKLPGFVCLAGKRADIPRKALSTRLVSWGERLAETRAVAESAERARVAERANRLTVAGQVAAGVAHEVRNPLAAIRSSVQLVRDGDVALDCAAPLLNGVIEEIDRVAVVLSGVLDAGRALPAVTRPVVLADVVTSCCDFLRGYTKVSGLSIHVAAPARSINARVNGHELRQVLINLLLNACQASRASSTITLKISEVDHSGCPTAVIQIIDEGVGMLPEHIERSFGPFFTTRADGSGLGLAICREIAERNGWQLSLTSQLGVGTTATIRIPDRIDDANPVG